MTVPDVNAPPVGEHGAPCSVCAAPLAGDQRYCLTCGHRRADARLPFREILKTSGVTGAPPSAAAPAPRPARADAAGEQRSASIIALASIACLLLALGVGVLIGSAGDSGGQPATASPQVISVGGATGTDGAAPAAVAGAGAAAKAKKSNKAKKDTSAPPEAQNPSLKKLEKLSPAQYQKQSQKLPKVVGTGGKPPPKDNKPAAGGGDFQEIG